MDRFKVGDPVRVVALHMDCAWGTRVRIGMTGVVATSRHPEEIGGKVRSVYRVDLTGFPGDWFFEEYCLAPLDDKADFQSFMERVLKPVDLGQPVTA
jgi:hypothetical protein